MDTQEAIQLELQVQNAEWDKIDPPSWPCVIHAYRELFPEAFFIYQLPDGRTEERLNMFLLPSGELISRLEALSKKQRTGRIRKDV